MKGGTIRRVLASMAMGAVASAGAVAACSDDGGVIDGTEGGDARAEASNDAPTNDELGIVGWADAPSDVTSDVTSDVVSDAPADVSPLIPPAKIVIVHAATAYGAGMMADNPAGSIRICYATKTVADPSFTLSPLPPYPVEVPDGGSGAFPGIPIGVTTPLGATGLPLEPIAIRFFVIDAYALSQRGVVGSNAADPRCNRLLQDGFVPDGGFRDGGSDAALEQDVHYWQLADVPAGTFKNGHTYVLAIVGCAANAAASDTSSGTICGGGYTPPGTPGVGNLASLVIEIDAATTIAADEMGVQVIHLSPPYAAAVAASPATVPPFAPSFGSPDGGDASVRQASASGTKQTITYMAGSTQASPIAKIKGIISSNGYFAANDDDPASVDQAYLVRALNNTAGVQPSIQFTSEAQSAPTTAQLFVNGKRYTFVLVGDPLRAQDDLRKAHFVGITNVFTPPPAF